ncbi:hAT family C-terminal dimerization region [Phytophthora infestans]|uniref:HAT family C-terminal dimerization region n=1 Tax=Phytophthora infestans TaxID=4787 RepID=A0A8S9VBE2_PHYIN|nr:hAT family C-terminal dimerization region [Phytophthora infestans]
MVSPPSSFINAIDTMLSARRTPDPLQFDINSYLSKSGVKKGKCRVCRRDVPWVRERVISHKVSNNCEGISENEKGLFMDLKHLRAGRVVVSVGTKRATTHVRPASPHKKRLFLQTTANFLDAISKADAAHIDAAMADLVFRTGISFRVIDSEAMKKVIRLLRPSYVEIMPSARSIAGKHLNSTYNKLLSRVREAIRSAKWFSIVSDGWSNDSNEHIVNYVVIVPGFKPFFLKSVSTGGVVQTSKKIAAGILEVIGEFGPDRCLSVVTDNAPNMRGAWAIIEKKYPTIFANGCGAHVLNLLIKDVCKIPEFAAVLADLNVLVKFVNDHKLVVAEFKRLRDVLTIQKGLTLPCPTRWYTHFNACENLYKAKLAVRNLAEPGCDHILKEIQNKDAVNTFRRIANSGAFWRKLLQLKRLLSFPSKQIGKLEKDGGDLFQVYYCFIRLKDTWVTKESLWHGDDIGNRLKDIVLKRWCFVHTFSMGCAYLLTPKSQTMTWDATDKMDTTEQLRDYIPLFYTDPNLEKTCNDELSAYILLDLNSPSDLYEKYTKLPGLEYWVHCGRMMFPLLAPIAIKVLSVPTSSAAAERVWSVYSFLWSKRRNRMNAVTMEKLAFNYINSSLLDSVDTYDYFGEELDDIDLFDDTNDLDSIPDQLDVQYADSEDDDL